MKKNYFQIGKKVKKDEIIESLRKCPICLSLNERKAKVTIQENPLIELLFCDTCKGLSASHMPTNELMHKYYADYYKGDELMITFHNTDRIATHIIKYINNNFYQKEISILDFGGGDGKISKKIAQILIDTRKIKYANIMLVDYARENIHNVRNGKIKFEFKEKLEDLSKKYNIVLASSVLEHIPQINKTIKSLFNLIEKDGFFYARTPYMSPFKKVFKKIDLSYPGHVHDLGASFWNRFIDTFQLKAELIVSKPSIVETESNKAFVKTLISYLFKFLATLEIKLSKNKKDLIWNYYGGWEVFIKVV